LQSFRTQLINFALLTVSNRYSFWPMARLHSLSSELESPLLLRLNNQTPTTKASSSIVFMWVSSGRPASRSSDYG
jgi:hypothetical protein